MNGVFEKWKEKLLDAGKGNRLINYKDTSRTIDVLFPDFETAFNKISNGDTFNFFDVDSYIKNLSMQELGQSDDCQTDKASLISKQQLALMLDGKLKKNQILCFKKGGQTQKILKNIKKVALDSLTEKGVNILYMAFGFLKWKEDDSAKEYLCSPIALIPISITSTTETKNAEFKVSAYEDEININPTLCYVMKNMHGINFPQYQDEQNPEETIIQYFERISQTVSHKSWSIKSEVAIGTFSFLKMNMYKDLEENEQTIVQNINVKKLLNQQVEENEIQTIDIDEYFKQGKELTLHNVVDADSSQMQAIVRAQSGKSFVLQGPPGTGKSQTITNLVAEYLFNNKKVLFVSEKLEALNVVYNNLKKVGLQDFCLELHSHKTNKKQVINELSRLLYKQKSTITPNTTNEIEELKKAKAVLDEYDLALHTTVPIINKTPYQIYGELAKLNDSQKFEYAMPLIEQKGEDYLIKARAVLDTYSKYSQSVGSDYHKNAWFGFLEKQLSYSRKIELKKELIQTKDYLQNINTLSTELNQKLQTSTQKLCEIISNEQLNKIIANLNFFDANLFKVSHLKNIYENVVERNKLKQQVEQNKEEFGKEFLDEMYELDLKEYHLRFRNQYTSIFRIFNKNYRKDTKIVKSYQKNPKNKLSYNDITQILGKGKFVQTGQKELEHLETKLVSLFANKQDVYDWEKIEKEIKPLAELLKEDFSVFTSMNDDQFTQMQAYLIKHIKSMEKLEPNQQVANKLQQSFEKTVWDLNQSKVECSIAFVDDCLEQFENLENWLRFCEVLNQLDQLDLREFVDLAIENGISPNDMEKTFCLMFYDQWLYHLVQNNQVLGNFSRISHDMAVQKFKEKDKLKFEIAKAQIIAKLSENRPSFNTIASGSQASVLMREANKKRKQKPVRVLLQEIGELVQTLKPCFLMSPLSVSTYLNHDCKFDVVIFDEASQIFPWDAIGSIYRANQVIVVGDSKQMPPSNFFNAEIEGVIDEENYDDDSLDFESILDLCATSFNQERLMWHYRSKTEELITFSNKNFYDGNLVTFPSASKDNLDMGVEFFHVENGIFDRKTKTNLIEAEKVVDLVFEHFQKYPNRSLGVVAFSISQQAAIETIIEERREKDDKFAKFFASDKPERFFVKNLETVQGDERDTIIFSVAYARDAQGKFLHNFGPLNRVGGERRLNVAITRARMNVKLVSSITHFDIDLNRTKSVGAKLLKDYLFYAEMGGDLTEQNISSSSILKNERDFEDEVYNVLTKHGYVVAKNVGNSSYKINFAIKHPNKSDYVLAIECDGDNYHSQRTTRDRDRLRQEVLERMGWKFHRIWSTEWFANNKIEKQKLLDIVQKAVVDFGKKPDSSQENFKQEKPVFITEQKTEKINLKAEFEEYEVYDILANYKKTGKLANFDNSIFNIVKAEAPITHELLLKRTLVFFGREKVTNVVRENFNYLMKRHPEIIKIEDYYVVDKNKKIEMRVPKPSDTARDIMLIPIVELCSGIRKIVQLNVGITKDGLNKTIASLLGFSRIGDNIRSRLELALEQEIKKGTIKQINGQLFAN